MTYTLPELPYDYAVLEPRISAKIMGLHHDRYHAAYVAGVNTALMNLKTARGAGDLSKVNQFSKDLVFNLGGHTNHSIFWANLSPAGGGQPEDELTEAVRDSFGSFEKLIAHFTAATTGIQGSEWAVLAYDSISEKLIVFQLFDQQANVPAGTIPLFMLDMWEHASYLGYLNVKADYVKAVWNIANWENVAKRLEAAEAQVAGLVVR